MSGIQNRVVMALGRKGTGKSRLLWEKYTSRAERVLSLGVLPQDLERDPDVIKVLGMGRLMDALKQAARHPSQRWHIATALEPSDLTELFTMLAPPMGTERASLSEAFNGMAIESGEAYEIFPNGRTPDEILAAPRRGRHYKLDMYFGSQRPASCSRDLTAAADHIYAFAQSEPRDLDFLAGSISKAVAQRVARLGEHEYIFFDRGSGIAQHFDANGRSRGRIDLMSPTVRAYETRPLAGQKMT